MGSPEFALPSLRALIDSGHEIVAVFTQPDRAAGRGRKASSPPVKQMALERGLAVHQPASISKPDVVEQIRALAPDAGVIAAYGQILKQPVLDAPRLGVLNVHASLLPRWRGASPVTAALLAGDRVSGATIMRVVLKLDAGPILDQAEVPIHRDDTTHSLTHRIAEAGARALVDVLPRYERGAITPREQDESLVTYAPPVKKEDALIDWEAESAEQIERKARAYFPWPVAFTHLDGQPLRILEAVELQHRSGGEPGTISPLSGVDEPPVLGAGFAVATTGNDVGIVKVQPAGGRVMMAADYLRGHRDIAGKRFGGATG